MMPAPRPETPLPVSFLTDFGYEDEFTGVCRAVIFGVDPDIRVIDVTHGIPQGDLRRGALALAAFVHYSTPAVHLAVVDPGVGTARRAVAIEAGNHYLVGPDNGLLVPAAECLGGADRVIELTETPVRLNPTSATFHGRDIFSPVAASLAAGSDFVRLGAPLAADALTPLDMPRAELERDRLLVHVLVPDRFGNLVLDADRGLVEQSFLAPGRSVVIEFEETAAVEVTFRRTFGDAEPGQPLLYCDSSGRLNLAVNGGDAAEQFGLQPDDELILTPA